MTPYIINYWSRCPQESSRDSHIHLASILSCSGDTVEHHWSLTVTLQVDIPPSQQHSYDSPVVRSNTRPGLTMKWKMNERLHWKLLADIIIHLHLHYHHLNISSTPPHHSPGHIRAPIREQLGVRWGGINQWGLSVAVMMSNWCGILKCSFSQHLPKPESTVVLNVY